MSTNEEGEDVKPKLGLIVNYEGQQFTVKVRANTVLKKVFDAAEKKFGKAPGTFKFFCDGERLLPQDTPGQRGLEDGDQIDAHLEQLGGQ